MAAHALLAPSSADRWINCPGSIGQSEGKKDWSGYAGAEGTAAHVVVEKMLKGETLPLIGEPATINGHVVHYDENMLNHAKRIVEFVAQLGAGDVYVEQRVNPGIHDLCWGTLDVAHASVSQRVLTVVDYKYGFVEIPAADNSQLEIYALGGLALAGAHNFDWVRMVIVQPRCAEPLKQHIVPTSYLLNERLPVFKAAATAAVGMDGGVNAGAWCRYCRARMDCPAQHNLVITLADLLDTPVKELTSQQAEYVWQNKSVLQSVLRDVENVLMEKAAAKQLVNYKLVNKRTNEAWVDENIASTAIANHLGMAAFKLKTPKQVKELPGADQKFIQSMVVRPVGQLGVALKSSNLPEHDPVQAILNADRM